jgi:RNA polymerase sigma factor (sigma-70 family)
VTGDVPGLVDHLFRREAGRMIAALTRAFGPENLDLAEDVVQEALIQALRTWPFRGVPDQPAAWLIQVAKNRALDLLRRNSNLAGKEQSIRGWVEALSPTGGTAPDEEELDDQLRMIFICCQPAVPKEARVALTLKTVGGFGVPEIARAFLAKEATIAQRLVRAKHKIREIRPPFAVPPPDELPEALDAVLEVLYAMFNEGHMAGSGAELVRRDVCLEAVRLARLVAEHPGLDTPKAHALAALLLLQASRLSTRLDADGNLLLLQDQDRSLWHREMLTAGFAHLENAARGSDLSVYHLEAGIAVCHATATTWEETDWPHILRLYDALLERKPSPVVALNRAVALAQVEGPHAGLAALEPLREDPALTGYLPLHATRGELLARSGDREEAAVAFRTALDLEAPEPVRRSLESRLRQIDSPTPPPPPPG